MTDEKPEIVFEDGADDTQEATTSVECDSLPFWVALGDKDGNISERLVRAWVFGIIHAGPDTPLTPQTLGYMEAVTQWIVRGVSEETKLKVVKK